MTSWQYFIIAILGALPAFLMGMLSFIQSLRNARSISDNHTSLMTQGQDNHASLMQAVKRE